MRRIFAGKRGQKALPESGRAVFALEIAAALAFKAAALVLLYLLFFASAHHIATSPSRVASFILGAAAGRN